MFNQNLQNEINQIEKKYNVKINVEHILICPHCLFEHAIYESTADNRHNGMFYFANFRPVEREYSTSNDCPFGRVWFDTKDDAIKAMENLIKFSEAINNRR